MTTTAPGAGLKAPERIIMQAILINVDHDRVEIVNPDGLEDWYKLMDVSLVDIAYRAIGKQHRYYNIICDDNGLLTSEPKISAVSNLGTVMLVGNLIIAGDTDDEGNLKDLTEEDIRYISRYIRKVYTNLHPEGYQMLTQCEY